MRLVQPGDWIKAIPYPRPPAVWSIHDTDLIGELNGDTSALVVARHELEVVEGCRQVVLIVLTSNKRLGFVFTDNCPRIHRVTEREGEKLK